MKNHFTHELAPLRS